MPSGIYTNAMPRVWGGDIDWLNDSFSAYLIDLNTYAPDLANDADISAIPEGAILSEVNVAGTFINGLALFADTVTFPSVPAGDAQAGAVVIFKDTEFESSSYLVSIFDEGVSPDFPLTLDGTDVTITWPAEGLILNVITVV